MRERGDGTLRLANAADPSNIGAALTRRANSFVSRNPDRAEAIRRLFSIRLTHVPQRGEPVRRWGRRDDCTPEEWTLVEQLASAEWRLVTISDYDGVPAASVAHEVLIREWPQLRDWINAEREFLTWRDEIELQATRYKIAPYTVLAACFLAESPASPAYSWLSLLESLHRSCR